MTQNMSFNVTWLSGMPRSGTTWMSQIFASSPEVRLKFCPLFSYEFKNVLNEESSTGDWEELFFNVYKTKSEFLDQDYLRKKGLVPYFEEKKETPEHLVIKSTRFHNLTPHLLEKNSQVRFVHLVRHPCASLHSWLTNEYEFPSTASPLLEWRKGACRKTEVGEFWGFDDWKYVNSQALRLEKKYPDRFQVIRYEELIKDTANSVKALFLGLGIPYDSQTDEFIRLSRSKHDTNKRSVYKKTASDEEWVNSLDPKIISTCLDELRGTELEKFLKE